MSASLLTRLDAFDANLTTLHNEVLTLQAWVDSLARPGDANTLRRKILEQRAELAASRFEDGSGRFGWRPRTPPQARWLWERETATHHAEVRLKRGPGATTATWCWRLCALDDPETTVAEGIADTPRHAMRRADRALADCP